MAVRFDAAADRLLRTASNPSGAFTVMFWVYLVSDLNTYSTFFYIGANDYGSNYLYLGTNSNGTQLLCDINGAQIMGSELSVATWYHVALAFQSGGSNTASLYLNGALVGSSGTSPAQPSTARFEFGAVGTSNFDRGDIRVAAIKLFNGEKLTLTEIQAERFSIRPKRAYTAFWPCHGGATERLRDYGPNAYNFTAGGTLTDEAGPPLPVMWPWSYQPWSVAAGGGTTHEGGAGLGAAGWMLSKTSRIAIGGAGLGAAGWLLAAGQLVKEGALGVGGTGFIGALGERVALGSAQLGAAGWLSGQGYRILEGGTGQGGAGWLSVETLKILIGAAGLEAIGRINAEASATGTGTTHTGQASLDGHGYILAAAERVAQAASGQGGAGWLSAFGQLVDEAAANLAAAGFINAAGQRVALGAVELPGAGWVNVSIVLTISASATMGAAGYMSVRALAQASQISAGNRTPYSPNTRDVYQPEPRTGKAPRARRVY